MIDIIFNNKNGYNHWEARDKWGPILAAYDKTYLLARLKDKLGPNHTLIRVHDKDGTYAFTILKFKE